MDLLNFEHKKLYDDLKFLKICTARKIIFFLFKILEKLP